METIAAAGRSAGAHGWATLTPSARTALEGLVYTGAPLDRAEPLREDATAVGRLRREPASRVVLLWRNQVLVDTSGGRAAPRAMVTGGDWTPADPALTPDETVFLGRDGAGVAWFAAQLPAEAEGGDEAGPDTGLGGRFLPLRTVGPALPPDEAAILAQALGVLAWHRRHRFCAACGAPSVMADAGYRRRCTDPACGAGHFPRTDPAVIMLVHHGRGPDARCLLARGARLPPRMVSTLAGFVEPGESLEEAVRREVHEETGLRVGRLAYGASQPWPFPASIMLGFHCEAETTDIVLDPRELEHAAWHTRAEVAAFGEMGRDAPESGWLLPRTDSIARRLILGWLAGEVFEEASP
ncbi:NAD(+) diphosphatase [Roseospira navarrensis]|uniref:NAD(+) diphosphatase n=1 Tax=Roseospira navarrensis TaxID=140058 RepID=A0A7X1ZBD6_9PROT|nr:NAD(+) diphosphatase [Roseospira navarrensis]MQX34909.1 NAD(+) diphosphatase [Roseospira navarrensis]